MRTSLIIWAWVGWSVVGSADAQQDEVAASFAAHVAPVLELAGNERIVGTKLLPNATLASRVAALRELRASADHRVAWLGDLYMFLHDTKRRRARERWSPGKELRDLRRTVAPMAFVELFRTMAGSGNPTFNSFRNGVGIRLEGWLFESRARKIADGLAAAAVMDARSQLTACSERWLAEEESEVLSKDRLRLTFLNKIDYDRIRFNGKRVRRGKPWTIAVKARSPKEALTNVVIVMHLTTTGRVLTVPPAEREVLRLANVGYENHLPQIEALRATDYLRETTPIGSIAYLPSLPKGKPLIVWSPHMPTAKYRQIRVRVYADEGRSPLYVFDRFGRPQKVEDADALATEGLMTDALSDAIRKPRVVAKRRGKRPAPPTKPKRPAIDPDELLRNPGCEEPLVDGEIPGWTVERGHWHRGKPGQAAAGSWLFSPSGGNHKVAELYQDVDLSRFKKQIDAGTLALDFHGRVRSHKQKPGDAGRIIIEFLAEDETDLGSGFESERIISRSSWHLVEETLSVPKKARTARVRLISIRRVPKNNRRRRPKDRHKSTDARFDTLSLKVAKP